MTIPVLEIEGGYRRAASNEYIYKPGSPQDPPSVVSTMCDPAYTDEDRAEYGLYLAVEFELPEGYEFTDGIERFELIEGVVHQVYTIQEIPLPPVLTDYEKLSNLLAFVGLTPEQLKVVLEEIE
jgi:hypothetical protein